MNQPARDPRLSPTFGPATLADFALARALEWLETDGLGGYASSTASGAHSRRYHGLLIAATAPPVGRKVLLSRLDETVHAGGSVVELGCNQFPGAVHPRGHERTLEFSRGLFPQWIFAAAGVSLRKTVAMLAGEPTMVVLYEALDARAAFELALRPFLAGRDDHALLRALPERSPVAEFAGSTLTCRFEGPYPDVFVEVPGASWNAAPDWWRDFEYERERERGFEFREDLFTPGEFRVRLEPDGRLGVLISTAVPGAGRDAFELFAAERARRESRRAGFADAPAVCRALAEAADQFLVHCDRPAEPERSWTVIAGYPWFADWGRDTMIALPGLCLVTKRFAEARTILAGLAGFVRQGLLPNRFPDRGEAPEYNTVDASLWYFVATWRYLAATDDETFVCERLLPVLRDMMRWHKRGTLHGIREDADGLLASGEPGVQLTWMDARVGDRVVTPRQGKPVEIQALWINALAILAQLEERAGETVAAEALRSRAARARTSFGDLFWNDDGQCLFDVVDGEARDASLRPNQILALALPFPVVDDDRGRAVLTAVERELLTPRGLRTLAPSDPAYRGIYAGGPAERDGAYHQGTVWPWLLGPYMTALVRLRGDEGRARARQILDAFAPHFGEAGLGTVSEIFDGEAPHAPRGCIAQAWSVAELLRAAFEDALLAPGTDL